MKKRNRFQIPTSRLEKKYILRTKSLLESVPEYLIVKSRKNDISGKKDSCDVPRSVLLQNARAIKVLQGVKRAMRNNMRKGRGRREALLSTLEDLSDMKDHLAMHLHQIEEKYLENLTNKETDKLDILNRMGDYVKSTQELKRERGKQDILVRIGFIMESLVEELAPYDETLGHVALQENAFKSKADTLLTKKNILLERRDILNAKLIHDAIQSEEMKKKLFIDTFKQGEYAHYQANLTNRLQEKDVKSMRAVVELEAKIGMMRTTARALISETAWIYWFLDWVLFDIFGENNLAGVGRDSSPLEKTQCVIDYYKNLRTMLADMPNRGANNVVDSML